MHLLWIFVSLFFVWISLLSNFSSLVCFDFSLMLTSFCFWEYTYLRTEPFRQRPWENLFPEITSEKLYEHQWYISKKWKWCWKILFERSLLFQSLSEVCHDHLYLFTLSLFRKGMTQKDISLSKKVVLEIKHFWSWIKDST